MQIETERLLLRPWKEEDLASLAKLYSDPRVMEFWEVRSLDDTKKDYTHFVSSIEENGCGFWAVELRENHDFIGLIGFGKSWISSSFYTGSRSWLASSL